MVKKSTQNVSDIKNEIGGRMMNAKAIGEKLKKLRGEKTLAEVAEGCNLTTQALSNYENGIRIPRDIHKISIARYYGVSVDSIFFDF